MAKEILTNTTVKEKEVRYIKKFKNLSNNEQPLPQGDALIKISPFDDYFMFTLFDEKNGEDTPIDLSNVGTIFISFIDGTDEIKIPNYTKVEDIDLSSGEVLFKISKEDSKKILSLTTKDFYISTAMTSEDGNESDESVLYIGEFSSVTEAARKSLTSEIENISTEYSKELAKLQQENENLLRRNKELEQVISDQETNINSLNASNEELSNEIEELNKEISSNKIKKLQQDSKEAQKLSKDNKKRAAQIFVNKQQKNKPNYESLIRVQQKYSI